MHQELQPIEGGVVGAQAKAIYDLKLKEVTSYGIESSIEKDFENGLKTQAIVSDINGNAEGKGAISYLNKGNGSTEYADGKVGYSFTNQEIIAKEGDIGFEKDFGNGLIAGAELVGSGGEYLASGHGQYSGESSDKEVTYQAKGNVDYNLNTKQRIGFLAGEVSKILVNQNVNVTGFAGLFSQVKDKIEGSVGARIKSLDGNNSANITAIGFGNLRGGSIKQQKLGNILGSFSHVIDSSSNIEFEVTRFPDGKFQADGKYTKSIREGENLILNFRIDPEGHFQLI